MGETHRISAASRARIRRLALARAVSSTGSVAAYVALSYAIYQETGSAVWVSAAVFATFGVMGFIAPLSGWLGDHLDRRRVMVSSDALAAVAAAAVAAVVGVPWLMVALTMACSAFQAPFNASSSAAVPNLVESSELDWANGLMASARSVGVVVGPVVAGVSLSAFGAEGAFLVNAASFALSAALVATIAGRFSLPRAGVAAVPVAGAFTAGFRFAARDMVVRLVVVAEFLLFVGMGIALTSDAPLADMLDAGPIGYAMLVTGWGLGQILGGLVVGRAAGRLWSADRDLTVLGLGLVGVSFGIGGVALFPDLWAVIAISFVGGFCAAFTFTLRQSLIQRRAPDVIRARVFAAADTLLDGGNAAGLAVAGVIVERTGVLSAYATAGLLILLASAWVLAGAARPRYREAPVADAAEALAA